MTRPSPERTQRARPTMHDVARLAGVSIKTVSRVVNREPGVSEQLADRVLSAARTLDYRPNLTASNLRRSGGKTRTIGLLVNDISNPFASALHRRIEDVARARGVTVMASSVDEDEEREQTLALGFFARRVDGLIIVPVASDHSYLLSEREAGTPLVFVDRPPLFLDADQVVTDNVGGARTAIAHLFAHGHQKIAYLGHLQSLSTGRERLAGYTAELAAANLPLRPEYLHQDLRTEEDCVRAVDAVLALADPPTAIFANQNMVGTGVIRALHHRGLQHDVALVAFDEIPLGDVLDPAITVVTQDVAGLGEAAAHLLFRRLDGETGPSQQVVLPTTLIARGSGEIGPRG